MPGSPRRMPPGLSVAHESAQSLLVTAYGLGSDDPAIREATEVRLALCRDAQSSSYGDLRIVLRAI